MQGVQRCSSRYPLVLSTKPQAINQVSTIGCDPCSLSTCASGKLLHLSLSVLVKLNVVSRESLTRGLQPSDLDRFHFYAKKVRVLGSPISEDEHGLHHLVLPTILSHRQDNGPLLPNVLDLVINLKDFEGMAILPSSVVGPRLHFILIRLPSPRSTLSEYPWDNVRSVLNGSLSSIRSFTVASSVRRDAVFRVPGNISDLIHSMPDLQQLNALPLEFDHASLSRFATLANLRILRISTKGEDLHRYLSGPHRFRSLGCLDLGTDDLAACTRFLLEQELKRLYMLVIYLRSGHEVVQNPDPLLEHLSQDCSTSILTAVNISQSVSGSKRSCVITTRTIAYILPFNMLQSVVLSLDGSVELDSATVKLMAMSWPHLRVLQLKERTTDTIPDVKLGDLAHFTAFCPDLFVLAIRVNALAVPEHADVGNVMPGRGLRVFDACTSPIDINDHFSVTRFLAMIFPAITVLQHGWDDDRLPDHPLEHSAAWGMVCGGMDRIIQHNRQVSGGCDFRRTSIIG